MARTRLAVQKKRRELVAQMLVSGMNGAEIHRQLDRKYIRRGNQEITNPYFYPNPDTGKGWSYETILNDIRDLESQWMEYAREDIDVWKGRILSRLEGLYRNAMRQNDARLAFDITVQQGKMLGVNAPEKRQTQVDITFEEASTIRERLQDKLSKITIDLPPSDDVKALPDATESDKTA